MEKKLACSKKKKYYLFLFIILISLLSCSRFLRSSHFSTPIWMSSELHLPLKSTESYYVVVHKEWYNIKDSHG